MRARLKTILISSLGTLAVFFAVTYISCNKDKCKTIVCAYGGTCNDGVCKCPTGYEGTQCESISREKFLGVWSVFEKGTTTNASQYTISIEKDSLIDHVVINNLFNYFTNPPVSAYVIHDSIIIPSQQISGKVITGVGYILDTAVKYHQYAEIIMSYKVVDSATGQIDDFGFDGAVDKSSPSVWNK